jgi:hypothetical protein
MLSPLFGNFSTPWGMSCGVGMWMPEVAFRVVQSTTFPNFSLAHTIWHGWLVIQNLVDLYALQFESWIEAILQVGLAKTLMLIVLVLGKDLSNVAPFYVFTTVNIGPWLRYILPPPQWQLFRIPKDMQPLLLNGTLILSAFSLQSSALVFWHWWSMAS